MATVGNALTGPDPAGHVAAGAISGLYIPSFPEDGDVTAVRFKLEDTGGAGDSFDVGIYSGNARLGVSTARTDISTAGTYEFTFGTPVTLTGGQPYRFVLGTNSTANSSIFTDDVGTYFRTSSNGSASPLPATNSGGWTDSGTLYASVEVVYTPAAAGLAITDVDTDESITGTQANVVITGTGFEAAQGAGTVEIFDQGAVLSVEPSIDSWSDTSIQFDMSIGTSTGIRYGAATLHVTNDSTDTDSIAITITPPSGVNYVNLSGTLADPEDRLESSADLEAGDQVEWSNVVGGSIGDVTVNIDGSFTAAEGVTAFDFRVHNVDDGWGSIETQDIGSGVEAPEITTTTLPDVNVLSAYDETIAATGDEPIVWDITSGTLPAGITLTDNVLSGSPTEQGTFTFTVRATNEAGFDTQALELEVLGLEIPATNGRGRRAVGRSFAVFGGR